MPRGQARPRLRGHVCQSSAPRGRGRVQWSKEPGAQMLHPLHTQRLGSRRGGRGPVAGGRALHGAAPGPHTSGPSTVRVFSGVAGQPRTKAVEVLARVLGSRGLTVDPRSCHPPVRSEPPIDANHGQTATLEIRTTTRPTEPRTRPLGGNTGQRGENFKQSCLFNILRDKSRYCVHDKTA